MRDFELRRRTGVRASAWTRLRLVTALVFAAFACLILPIRVRAFEASGTSVDLALTNGSQTKVGAPRLKQVVHLHVKWRFEYGFGHVTAKQPEGNLNIFQTRVEVDF
jgi:hypothetical protein